MSSSLARCLVHLHANDREGLAHLCGYGARPPFSQQCSLFDPHHVKNRPEVHGLQSGNDFVLMHNLFALVPFPLGEIRSGREFYVGLAVRDARAPRSDT